MKKMIEDLLALQVLQTETKPPSADPQREIDTLRKKIPESILRVFDRWIARRLKAVATLRNGVCSECHIKVPIGVWRTLSFSDEAQRCGNCGRFLYLPAEEKRSASPPATPAPPAPLERRKKNTLVHASL